MHCRKEAAMNPQLHHSIHLTRLADLARQAETERRAPRRRLAHPAARRSMRRTRSLLRPRAA
jgi:hypothetical protein